LVCASCGYNVQGLPSSICPECGSDLDIVGRLTPQFRRWQAVPPLLRAAMWTISVYVLGGILGLILTFGFSPQRHEHRDSQAFYLRNGTEEATIWLDRTVVRTLRPVAQGVYPTETLSRLARESISFQVDVRALAATPVTRSHFTRGPNGGWELRQPSRAPEPATPDLIAHLLSTAGLSIPQTQAERSPEQQRICESLVASFDLSAQAPEYRSVETDASLIEPRHARVGFGRTRIQYWPDLFLFIALWTLAWLVGLRFVLRRRPASQASATRAGSETRSF
jgi:hypothetical protein